MVKSNGNNVLIVIPTLGKREDYLLKTIESIKKQSYEKYDIALIYPEKNKFVSDLAEKLKAFKVADPGNGLSSALNAGVSVALPQHTYISWIGDDDLLAPKSLELTVRALEENVGSPVAYGFCDYIDKDGKFLFKSRAGKIAPWLMTWGPNLLPCPGALFRTKSILDVGGFDEANKYSMDLDMFLRLRKLGGFTNTKQTLASFRWHTDSMTVASRTSATREAERVKRKYTPHLLQPLSPLWFVPVRLLSRLAAKRLS